MGRGQGSNCQVGHRYIQVRAFSGPWGWPEQTGCVGRHSSWVPQQRFPAGDSQCGIVWQNGQGGYGPEAGGADERGSCCRSDLQLARSGWMQMSWAEAASSTTQSRDVAPSMDTRWPLDPQHTRSQLRSSGGVFPVTAPRLLLYLTTAIDSRPVAEGWSGLSLWP